MKYIIIIALLFSIGFVGYGFADYLTYTSFYSHSEFTTFQLAVEDNYVYGVPYSISTGQSIDVMGINCDTSDLVLYLPHSDKPGNLTVGLPRVLIDSKLHNGNDDVFFVIGDSKEIQSTEEYVHEGLRVLIIPFTENIKKITISGTNYPESPGLNSCNGIDENHPYSYLSTQRQTENDDDVALISDTFVVMTDHVMYNVPYHITNGTIEKISSHCELASLVVQINSNGNGELILEIPRELLDRTDSSDSGGEDNDFFVLLDGEEIEFEENKYDNTRATIIQFTVDSKEIEVIGSFLYPEDGADACKIIHNPPYSYLLPPLKQHDMGIAFQEIQCKEGLGLVGKILSADPACVKPESVEKLTMRGWATANKSIELANPAKYVIDKNDIPFEIQYSLKGATLESITHDGNANSVNVALDDSVGGQMVISIPRGLIDAKIGNNGIDDIFFVLIDGEEIMFGEITDEIHRTITIWFQNGAQTIEIIGTNWI